MDADGHALWRGRVKHVASQAMSYVEHVAGAAFTRTRTTLSPGGQRR